MSTLKCLPIWLVVFLGYSPWANGQEELPYYLKDRGTGIATSMFGTYVGDKEFLVFPFFAYSRDKDFEYQPDVFGVGPNEDYRGHYSQTAGQLFFAHGFYDWLALELELAYVRARFEKSAKDTFPTPAKKTESGIADFEGQLRVRFLKESTRHPEIFGFAEIVPRSNKSKILIGEPNTDIKPGLGFIKGSPWGTLTFRTTIEYTREDKQLDLGETSFEYLKKLSPAVTAYAIFEGGETAAIDEWELITGVHWRITEYAWLKLDNAFGISSKATDWSPQLGILFNFIPSEQK